LSAKLLLFRFDGQSRLLELQGQKQAALHAEPIPPAKGEAQDLSCRQLEARFVPASGELNELDARGEVEFVKGARHASAQRGHYEGSSGRLVLANGHPTLEEVGKSRITADRIELMTRTGDLLAHGDARQELLAGTRPGGFMVQAGQPTLLSAQQLVHNAAQRTTTYTGQALLRSGKDEVRAEELKLVEDAQGRRQLEAKRQVFSLLHPAEKPGAQKAAPIEVRAAAMSYDEANGRVVYTGDVTLKEDVTLKQGDVSTVSPTATLYLASDGRSLQKLVAGEPVELHQGKRTAKGQRATYTPDSQTIVVEGEPVSLQGPGQDVRGRSLTFQTGNDTILVSGQEEDRTETVFRKEPPRP
jgi:lipopolysaccharide transport protein LptA